MDVWWRSLGSFGLEHLHLSENDERVSVKSTILCSSEESSFHLKYQIICDEKWRIREVSIKLFGDFATTFALNSDGAGNWTGETGESLPDFSGCFDIDISATPFTNTLPIRRIEPEIGESINVSVIYFLIPEMKAMRSFQRYTRLQKSLYRFEENEIFKGFSADVQVDEKSLVIDYPQLFRRVKT